VAVICSRRGDIYGGVYSPSATSHGDDTLLLADAVSMESYIAAIIIGGSML